MTKRKRSIGSVKKELVTKSREAALTAIKVFNDPLITFKGETFIVLMIIAWTYLLHAYYRLKKIEYRYFKQGPKRRIFDRTRRGAYKHWELERCLDEKHCPIDKNTGNNLRFLIGLRHEIEHQMTRSLDAFLSGRYQACAMNYNDYLKNLFGKKYGIDRQLTYSIQFLEISEEQIRRRQTQEENIPKRVRSYIAEFDGALSHDEYNSPRYSFRMLFKKKLVNRPGQADRVIEFIDPKSPLAKEIDKEYWVKKEVERPKFRAKDVVEKVTQAGYTAFRINPEHLNMWRAEDAKNPAKGYGVEVQGAWYWYQNWIDRCIELCKAAGDRYIELPSREPENKTKPSKSVNLTIAGHPFTCVRLTDADFRDNGAVYAVLCVSEGGKWSVIDVWQTDKSVHGTYLQKKKPDWFRNCSSRNIWVCMHPMHSNKYTEKDRARLEKTVCNMHKFDAKPEH